MRRYATAIAVLVAGVLLSANASGASVCIDPGHGGSDPGAQGCGLSEAKINLLVSLKLRELLKASGVTTHMTRTTDVYVGLAARSSYANSKGVDRFASIHSNAGGGTGIETFCMEGSTSSSTGWKMASAIQDQMLAAWPLPNRGVKKANFAVLRETAMPATLSELAFIDKCSPDAEYLGSTERRDQAACAHLKAITHHLGISGACSTTPSTQGKALGAIFEDKGSGTEDMTTRLAGATASVKGGANMTVSGPDAVFTFTLEAGSHEIEASLDGYQSASVPCAVVANETRWCSIGLKKVVEKEPEDAGAPDADRPEPDAAPEAHAPDHDAELVTEDAETDAPDDPAPLGPNFWDQEDETGCACRTTPRSSASHGPWALAGLALLMVYRRRRCHRFASVLAGVALVGGSLACTEEQQAESARSGVGYQPLVPRTSPVRLSSPQKILDGGYLFPTMSPDGQWVAVTRPGLDALWLASADNGRLTELSREPRSGYLPTWRSDSGAVAHRGANGPVAEAPSVFVDLRGNRASSFLSRDAVSARQTDDDRIVVRSGGRDRIIDEGKDKYFSPIVSQDGSWVVYTGITLGIHLYRVEQETTVQLGQGTHPSLSADGKWLAYEKTDDNGEQLLTGDIYLCDLDDPGYPVFNLTRTPNVIERTPSLSSDGSRIAYVVEDGLYVALVER
jgi:N-acetylmuramoyl-L-alanine amidase